MFFAKELIEKYGVILCASAGNNGPGIDTCGAPAGYGAAIGVGAYVSTDMLKAEHGLLGNGSSMLFTWTSRGPMLDGNLFFLLLFELNFFFSNVFSQIKI